MLFNYQLLVLILIIFISESQAITEFEESIANLNLNYDSYNDDDVIIDNPGDDTVYRADYFTNTANSLSSYSNQGAGSTCEQKRYNSIFRRCNHRTKFSNYEINRARIYLQQRFRNADIPPIKPACKTLRVRRDFKCLSHSEKTRFIKAFIKLYKSGIVDTLAAAHIKYWGSTHKTAEGTAFHVIMASKIEKELLKITKDLSFPYWDNTLEFSGAEKSIIWDYFGRAGNAANGYCIDGPFKNVNVTHPTVGCIKRQWRTDGKIPRYEGPEYSTMYQQFNRDNFVGWFTNAFNQHFKKHIQLGGDNGYNTYPYAPNDPIFYLFHIHQVDQQFLQWEMISETNIVPVAYNAFGIYNYTLNQLVPVNIATSVMNYFDTTTIAEALQQTFGELCYVTDQFVEFINKLLDGIPPKLPPAVHKLRQALPPNVFAYYFPNFASNNTTYFDFDMPDIGNCMSQLCKPLPQTPFYNSTIGGINNYNSFKTVIGVDTTPFADLGEQIDYDFTATLNYYNYCSPYVI